ncbi:MAG: hypothetical protein R2839_06510 [Thermomicrobiales bacterium]
MTDPDSTPSTESEAIYKARTAQFREDHDALAGAEQRLSNLRLIAGFVFLTALIWFVLKLPPVAIVVAVLSGVVFSWLIVRHRRTAQARIRAGLLRDINQEALHRIARNWQDLPSMAITRFRQVTHSRPTWMLSGGPHSFICSIRLPRRSALRGCLTG